MVNYKNIIKGFDIVKSVDIFNDVVKYAKQGALRGQYLGFPSIEEYYTMSLPGVTDWTGFPRSGKTQVLMEFLLNTSEFYGWKHLVYFPDVGNAVEIIADLIHKRTGKTFDKRYKNHVTEMEISIEMTWVLEHFKILTKNDLKAKLTPYEFWDLSVKLKNEEGLHTASIDAWKDMRHDTTAFGRDDKYLEDVLSYRNAMAEKHKLHFHTIIHPTRTDKDASGNRKPPTPYDLKGGTEWFNNGKNMVTVHREGSDNGVKLFWNKIKPRSIGKTGVTEIKFDLERFRYYEEDMGNKLFANKEVVKTQKSKVSDIKPVITDNDDDLPF
jgi:hypothetical protein